MSLDIGYDNTSVAIAVGAIRPPSGMSLAVCHMVAAVDRLTDESNSHHNLQDSSLSFAQLCLCLYKHQLCKPCF